MWLCPHRRPRCSAYPVLPHKAGHCRVTHIEIVRGRLLMHPDQVVALDPADQPKLNGRRCESPSEPSKLPLTSLAASALFGGGVIVARWFWGWRFGGEAAMGN